LGPIQFSGDGGTTIGGINAYSSRVVIGRGTSTGVQGDFIINSNGVIGIGVVPQSWYTAGGKFIQFAEGGALWGFGPSNILLTGNEYFDTSGNSRYIGNDAASRYQQNAGYHRFSTAPGGTAGNLITLTERFRIHQNGNVTINDGADPGYKLYVAGTIYATGNITANSDLTLKKNLQIIDNPIDKLMQLNGYAYQWKEDDSHQYGVVAQEVEKILPYAVSTGLDGIKGVSYNQITPLLIEGFKSHESEITQLKKKVKIQQAEIDILKSKIA
jgi:hypothetical protein